MPCGRTASRWRRRTTQRRESLRSSAPRPSRRSRPATGAVRHPGAARGPEAHAVSNSSVVKCTSVTASSSIDAAAIPVTRAAGSVPNELSHDRALRQRGARIRAGQRATRRGAVDRRSFVPFTPAAPAGRPRRAARTARPAAGRTERGNFLFLPSGRSWPALAVLDALMPPTLPALSAKSARLTATVAASAAGVTTTTSAISATIRAGDGRFVRPGACVSSGKLAAGGHGASSQAASAVRLGPRLGSPPQRADGAPGGRRSAGAGRAR